MQNLHVQHSSRHDDTGRNRAIVIDDDPTSRLVTHWLLSREGYQVFGFQGLSQDIERIASLKPKNTDVIIIDFLLQDCSAIEFIEQLNAISGFSDIPKVVITAKRTRNLERVVLDSGAADFITKPLTTSKFVERVALTADNKKVAHTASQQWLPAVRPLKMSSEALPSTYSVLVVELTNFDDIHAASGIHKAQKALDDLAYSLNVLMEPNQLFMSRIGLSQIALVTSIVNRSELSTLVGKLQSFYQPKNITTVTSLEQQLAWGVATNRGKNNFNESLANAMFALMLSRKKGTHQVEFFNTLVGHALNRIGRIEHEIAYGDLKSMLKLHYAPQVSINNRQIAGLSAQVRLKTAALGQVSFAELAELSQADDYLHEVGLYMFELLFNDLRALPKHITVSLPLNDRLLRSQRFIANLNQLARTYNINKQQVEIELLQSVANDIDDPSLENIYRLKNYGFALVLDNFGLGSSNLNQLLSLPISKLKLDDYFAQSEHPEHRRTRLIKAISLLTDYEGIKLVVKNVKSQKEYDTIKTIPNALAQGEIWGRPAALTEILTQLEQNYRYLN